MMVSSVCIFGSCGSDGSSDYPNYAGEQQETLANKQGGEVLDSISLNQEVNGTMTKFVLPSSFVMTEDFIALGSDFSIDGVGSIKERLMNMTKTFELLDTEGELVAKAKEKMFTWGVEIGITDENGVSIGSVEEKVFESFWKVSTEYVVKDASGNIVGTSKKFDRTSTDFVISDNTGSKVATFKRPFINLVTDKRNCTLNSQAIDSRLLIFIPCFKTSRDSERKDDEDDKEDKK